LKPRKTRSGSDSSAARAPQDLAGELAVLITSIKPFALCDSCIALDVHVSHAEARDAAVSVAMSDAFERKLQRCHRCGRTVEATSLRSTARVPAHDLSREV
jgi:hypothetical protein